MRKSAAEVAALYFATSKDGFDEMMKTIKELVATKFEAVESREEQYAIHTKLLSLSFAIQILT